MRWQYKVLNLGAFNVASQLVTALAHLGQEGWEVAAMMDKASNWIAAENAFLLLKRPVPDGQEPVGPWAEEWSASRVEDQASNPGAYFA